MPPKLDSSNFDFSNDEGDFDHVDGLVDGADLDPSKYHLFGIDHFDRQEYPLAIDLDTIGQAELLARARRRQLERIQPSKSSGGQGFGGLQDGVKIVYPTA